jgi:hypothetical protein
MSNIRQKIITRCLVENYLEQNFAKGKPQRKGLTLDSSQFSAASHQTRLSQGFFLYDTASKIVKPALCA